MSLESQFAQRLLEAAEESSKIGPRPSYIISMIKTDGGVATAKKLVKKGRSTYGLERIVKLGRPDLSLEWIMLEERFASLFTEKDLDNAKQRLQQLKVL